MCVCIYASAFQNGYVCNISPCFVALHLLIYIFNRTYEFSMDVPELKLTVIGQRGDSPKLLANADWPQDNQGRKGMRKGGRMDWREKMWIGGLVGGRWKKKE